jgi:arsenite-transporting ATPase
VTALDTLLHQLPRTSFIVGKGGVGKTTCAVGLAASFAQRGAATLLLSTDPAAALSEVIGEPVATSAAPVGAQPGLHARQLFAPTLRQGFLDRWRDIIAEIVDRGTYLDRGDVDGLVDAALPGVDEIFALLALADLLTDRASEYERIVVDTAPTGHTLRLLALPETFRALLAMLDLMQNKHRFMVRALTRRYRRDAADDFLDEMRARIDGLRAVLADARTFAAVVVTRDEPLVIAETRRYVESLHALHVRIGAVVVNAVRGPATPIDFGTPPYWIPRAKSPPRGLESVKAIVGAITDVADISQSRRRTRAVAAANGPSTADGANLVAADKTLTIVGGKGGVGKSTVACALAIAAVDVDARPTLLVSTDPAPSIADAFGAPDAPWARADLEHAVADVPGLVVRQMDATAAFGRVRDEYRNRIDALFTALVGRGIDIDQDRAIVRDLLALAPPGIDELFALSILGDTLAEGRFARIVVDPAPTGHLLRLLEMPAVALDWSHRLMRLMLKYRDIVGLGDSAQELLDFARRTRALDVLLHDPVRSGLVLVSLDEPVVRAETERLAAAVRARAIDVTAVIWNRTKDRVAPLPESVAARQLFAREESPPPTGVAALRVWSKSWRTLSGNI